MGSDSAAGAGSSVISEAFDRDALIAAARQEAGLEDFGGDEFLEPLTRWLEALKTEANLSPSALESRHQWLDVQRMLVNRLRFQADLKKHPEILDEVVANPIVILGLARTGSTKLQRILSQDPAVQKLWFWRMMYPAPLPGWKPGEPDPRIDVVKGRNEQLAQEHPEIYRRGHAFLTDEPEEELGLFQMTFESFANGSVFPLPAYREWLQTRPARNAYAYLYRLLQYLQWQDGGGRDRPWVLKSPVHLGYLETVLETFPDATVVHTHRHPRAAIGSLCSRLETRWSTQMNEVDPVEVGAMQLRLYAGEMAKYLVQRARLEDRAQIVDVRYADTCSDPVSVARAVYEFRGQNLTPEAARAMSRWNEKNPQDRFGEHSYSLEHYGLSTEAIDHAFAPYLERFGSYL